MNDTKPAESTLELTSAGDDILWRLLRENELPATGPPKPVPEVPEPDRQASAAPRRAFYNAD